MSLPTFPIALALRTLPNALHAELLARLFNHLMRGQAGAERFAELEGKHLCLSIRDTGSELMLRVRGGRLQRAPGAGAWDVRIHGALADFVLLATRSEDPDTLFFSRRLALEGDTETGLHVKNLLDSLEFDAGAHFESVLGPTLGRACLGILQTSGVERRIRSFLR